MKGTKLKARISGAPTAPGVYTWRGLKGRVLYVGKAVNLRSRLLSYLRYADPRPVRSKTRNASANMPPAGWASNGASIMAMVAEADTIEWTTIPTEIEALILESQRIKLLKPKYNIVMRDDKQYAYVGLTDEEFPQPIVTHQVTSPRVRKPFRRIIGPFTDAGSLTTTVRWLRGLFPYCTCKQKHHVRCLNAHLGKCPGYCCLRQSSSQLSVVSLQQKEQLKTENRKLYTANIRAITDILDGKRDTLIGRLEREMKKLGAAHKLEKAYALQRRIGSIRRVFENAQLVAGRRRLSARHPGAPAQLADNLGLAGLPRRVEGYDVAHIQGAHPSGAMVVFSDGLADRSQYRLFNLHSDAVGDTAQLREMLTRRLTHDEWPLPDLILVDGGKAQLNVMVRALDAAGHAIPVIALTKDDHHQADHLLSSLDSQVRMLTDLPRPLRSLVVHIDNEAHRFSVSQYRRRHRKSLVEK